MDASGGLLCPRGAWSPHPPPVPHPTPVPTPQPPAPPMPHPLPHPTHMPHPYPTPAPTPTPHPLPHPHAPPIPHPTPHPHAPPPNPESALRPIRGPGAQGLPVTMARAAPGSTKAQASVACPAKRQVLTAGSPPACAQAADVGATGGCGVPNGMDPSSQVQPGVSF